MEENVPTPELPPVEVLDLSRLTPFEREILAQLNLCRTALNAVLQKLDVPQEARRTVCGPVQVELRTMAGMVGSDGRPIVLKS